MEILIPQTYTRRQVDLANLKRVEFRPNRYTSGSANLDDLIALGKAVILCGSHVRRFDPKAARYRAHPAKNMRRVNGRCDICKQFGLSHLFLNQKDADEQHRSLMKFKRAMEYGRFLQG